MLEVWRKYMFSHCLFPLGPMPNPSYYKVPKLQELTKFPFNFPDDLQVFQ